MVATWTGAGSSTAAVEVVTTAINKAPVFCGKHGNDWTIWEMKMTAHLMDKGLDMCLEQDFESKFPTKEIGPFENNESRGIEQKGNGPIHSGFFKHQSFEQG